MLSLRNFALRRGEHLLLSGVDATLYPGWRVGVVGRNGCGKSSLFAVVRGELEPDVGALDLPAGTRIASVLQETPALPDAAIDYVLGGDADLHAAVMAERAAVAADDHAAAAEAHHRLDELGGYDAEARAGRLLHGLGFPADTHGKPVKDFSGGWRVRLNLARALMCPSDLLLLDEPTNHLDLDAVLWLEEWLKRYPGTLLVISHDREFLDGVVDHVLHLHEGKGKLYSGNFTSFERQRNEHLRQQQIAHEKEQAVRAHLQSFVDRFRAKASKAKQAQSRLKRIEKLAGTEAVRAESPFRFEFARPDKLPNPLVRLHAVDCGYPPAPRTEVGAASAATAASGLAAVSGDSIGAQAPPTTRNPAHVSTAGAVAGSSDDADSFRIAGDAPRDTAAVILHAVGFGLEPGDRIALLGPNGAGKSTLVKTLVGELEPLSGERLAHPELRIGYFAQHTVEALREGASPVDHLRDLAPGLGEQGWRNYLGRWNFVGDRAFEPVDNFSGGEKARLALALIAWSRPNLLLLDEPTNHLDMDMREALAEALAEFDGALVLVSHDRHLIGMVCDRFFRVADGQVEGFDGDLDDYAVWLRRRDRSAPAAPKQSAKEAKPAAPVEPAPPALSDKERRRLAAESRERERPLRNRLKRVETRLEAIGGEMAALEAALADPALYAGDSGKARDLLHGQAKLAAEREALEAEWLELSESLEAG
jgi:ATP-binding cassette, subfamily F, member 3